MDRFLDFGAENEIHTESGVKSRDHEAFANDMLDYNLHSCMANEIDSPGLELSSETGAKSSDQDTLSGDMLERSSDFCMTNGTGSLELSEKQEERYCSETRVIANEFVTPTASMCLF